MEPTSWKKTFISSTPEKTPGNMLAWKSFQKLRRKTA